jgi:hypothetical protein
MARDQLKNQAFLNGLVIIKAALHFPKLFDPLKYLYGA